LVDNALASAPLSHPPLGDDRQVRPVSYRERHLSRAQLAIFASGLR
jgi:hypothetical protein